MRKLLFDVCAYINYSVLIFKKGKTVFKHTQKYDNFTCVNVSQSVIFFVTMTISAFVVSSRFASIVVYIIIIHGRLER